MCMACAVSHSANYVDGESMLHEKKVVLNFFNTVLRSL